MGSAGRIRPERLAEKLLAIRSELGLNLIEMADKLSTGKIKLRNSDISRYETGLREPPLTILLNYATVFGIAVENLIDDDLEINQRALKKRK